MKRIIVQIAIIDKDTSFVLCNDGTIWRTFDGTWFQVDTSYVENAPNFFSCSQT